MAAKVWNQNCGSISRFKSLKYCEYSNSKSPAATVWYFHGIGDSEKVFAELNLDLPAGQFSEVDFLNLMPPVKILVLSWGPRWLVSPAHFSAEVWAREIVPELEKKLDLPKSYLAVGHSMGGFSLVELCLGQPQLFSRCALLNPLLPSRECDPFQLNWCNPGPGFLLRSYYSEKDWRRLSPIFQASQVKLVPPVYLTACKLDRWDFFSGPRQFVDELAAHGYRVVWSPKLSDCDHDLWPATEVIQFLFGSNRFPQAREPSQSGRVACDHSNILLASVGAARHSKLDKS
jgi:pimeloyl-ACP methyl ester carboxylesterase